MNEQLNRLKTQHPPQPEEQKLTLRQERSPILRWPVCQNRFERLNLDAGRGGTVCQGCRYDLREGCPNTRAWSLDGKTGEVKAICEPEALVYCRHYDCGCDLCANYLNGTPLPFSARG